MAPVISIQNVKMHFRGCDALQGVDLEIQSGRVFALLGENGAGKTTLIRILTGFQRASSGTCSVLGLDPTTDSLEIRRRVGYVSDAPALYDWMRVGEIGWFAASFYPPGFVERYCESLKRFELPIDRKIRQLSKGQRSKVALSLALAHEPELLILDEPTSGLDPIVRREFMESMIDVAATGRTVFLSSHQIAEVERVADDIGILHQGRLRLVGNLGDARESMFVATVGLNDPLVSLPELESPTLVMHERSEGRQRQFIFRGDADLVTDEWRKCDGVMSVEVRSASLDEMFLACTRSNCNGRTVGTRNEPAEQPS